MWKLIVAIIGVIAVCYIAITPMTVYTFDILFTVNDNYDMSFLPTYYLREISTASFILSKHSVQSSHTYSLAGISSVYLNVNASAFNEDGVSFFNGSVVINTLAEHKIYFDRQYDAASYTKNLTLHIDAHLLIDFDERADIDKTYHGEWNLVIP